MENNKNKAAIAAGAILVCASVIFYIVRGSIAEAALNGNDYGELIVVLTGGLLYAGGLLFIISGYAGNMTVLQIARGSMIAAMYAVLTLSPGLNALSYGQVQFRVSEMLMPLALFEPAAVPGLWIGCIVANIGSPFGALDLTLGAGMTLLAAVSMRAIGKHWYSLAAPVIVNAVGVALVLNIAGELPYWPSVLWVGLGEAGVMVALGAPLFFMLKNNPGMIGLKEQGC